MPGLTDVAQAAFSGGKPGPNAGKDVDATSALAAENISNPREGANLIFDALGPDRKAREQRAINRMNARRGLGNG